MIKAIIVEDEIDAQNLLSKIIISFCPEVELIACIDNIMEAKDVILDTLPDLVFLDIQLGTDVGFDLLDMFEDRTFKVVFTTAFKDYALKAIKYDTVDYILKPYSPKEVVEAVKRVDSRINEDGMIEQINILGEQSQKDNNEKISVATSEGIHVLNIEDIVRVEADSSYCVVHLFDGVKTVLSKPLKEMVEILPDNKFFRIHASHLINISYIEKYQNSEGGYALLTEGTRLPISRRRRQFFIDLISKTGLRNEGN